MTTQHPKSGMVPSLTATPDDGKGIVMRSAAFAYPEATVLAGCDLFIPKGGTCVITGANGSGKSTLLYILAGLVSVQAGKVSIGGYRADPKHPSALMRRGVRRGFVFQEGGVVSNMNALANVALALRYHADLLGLGVEDVERRARAALERVRVSPSDMYALPAHLSFGVRKRVALARAIALEPNFFYFDDPDFGLDQRTAELVYQILAGYRDDPEVTTVVATNREALVDRLGVPGYVLINGRLLERHELPPSSYVPRSRA